MLPKNLASGNKSDEQYTEVHSCKIPETLMQKDSLLNVPTSTIISGSSLEGPPTVSVCACARIHRLDILDVLH